MLLFLEIQGNKNVLLCMQLENFRTDLEDMKKKMDQCEKTLLSLLQKKRKDFPRFYFLSNDDLFEILGSSKEPAKINKHISKCFTGIKVLDFSITQVGGRGKGNDQFKITQMSSADGELVPFYKDVTGEVGELPVELWMKSVELQMKETLSMHLTKTLQGLSKKELKSSEKLPWVEKWINENEGQLLIVGMQVVWNEKCKNLLEEYGQKTVNKAEKPMAADRQKQWKIIKDEKRAFLFELTRQVILSRVDPQEAKSDQQTQDCRLDHH